MIELHIMSLFVRRCGQSLHVVQHTMGIRRSAPRVQAHPLSNFRDCHRICTVPILFEAPSLACPFLVISAQTPSGMVQGVSSSFLIASNFLHQLAVSPGYATLAP
jgi:hypothetical protein